MVGLGHFGNAKGWCITSIVCIRIKSDLPFLLKKKWTRAKRDGGLSDPINHEVFGGDSLLPLACSIHLEIITFRTTIQIT